jgi:replicative superfamily II helicase
MLFHLFTPYNINSLKEVIYKKRSITNPTLSFYTNFDISTEIAKFLNTYLKKNLLQRKTTIVIDRLENPDTLDFPIWENSIVRNKDDSSGEKAMRPSEASARIASKIFMLFMSVHLGCNFPLKKNDMNNIMKVFGKTYLDYTNHSQILKHFKENIHNSDINSLPWLKEVSQTSMEQLLNDIKALSDDAINNCSDFSEIIGKRAVFQMALGAYVKGKVCASLKDDA